MAAANDAAMEPTTVIEGLLSNLAGVPLRFSPYPQRVHENITRSSTAGSARNRTAADGNPAPCPPLPHWQSDDG